MDIEAEIAKKLEEDELAEIEASKPKKAKKQPKKGKGNKVEDEEEVDSKFAKMGPNELIRKFDDFYDDYNSKWENLDENDNPNQHFAKNKAKDEMMPVVEKEITLEVDEMIKTELENLRLVMGIKAKKKKKKGGKKKGRKGKKAKKIPLPGGKLIYEYSDYEILKELVNCQICKYMPPAALSDFLGEFNYIGSMLDDLENCPFDPSMAIIR